MKKQYQDDGGRGDLTDEQWEKLRPLLPPQKAWTGQPAADHRRILNGILWLHRTGAPWRDLPAERYGNHRTISSRFYRWRKAGLWQQLWSSLMQQADAVGEIDWEVHLVDGTIVRAHQVPPEKKGRAFSGNLKPIDLSIGYEPSPFSLDKSVTSMQQVQRGGPRSASFGAQRRRF